MKKKNRQTILRVGELSLSVWIVSLEIFIELINHRKLYHMFWLIGFI